MGAAAQGVIKTLIGYSRGRDLQSLLPDYVSRFGVRTAVGRLSVTAKHIGSVLDGGAGKTRKVLSAIGVVYFTARVMIKWHNALIDVNYRRYAIECKLPSINEIQ